jgi:hypothetical protein
MSFMLDTVIFTVIAVPKKTEAALSLHLGDRVLLYLWRLHVLQQPVLPLALPKMRKASPAITLFVLDVIQMPFQLVHPTLFQPKPNSQHFN